MGCSIRDKRGGLNLTKFISSLKRFLKERPGLFHASKCLYRFIRGILSVPKMIVALISGLFFMFYKVFTDRETLYIVCSCGIGDTVFISTFVKAYKEKYQRTSVKLIVRKYQKDLLSMFPSLNGGVASTWLAKSLTSTMKFFQQNTWFNFKYGHMVLNFGWPHPCMLIGVKGIQMLDVYRQTVMRLPVDATLEFPEVKVSQEDLQKLQALFPTNAPSVLLMPYAKSLKMFDFSIWEQVARQLTDKGYAVFTNVGQGENVIAGTQPVTVGLREMLIIGNHINISCIAIRSGLCDLLAFTKIKMLVLYEKGWSEYDPNKQNRLDGMELPNKHILCAEIKPDEPVEKIAKYIVSSAMKQG